MGRHFTSTLRMDGVSTPTYCRHGPRTFTSGDRHNDRKTNLLRKDLPSRPVTTRLERVGRSASRPTGVCSNLHTFLSALPSSLLLYFAPPRMMKILHWSSSYTGPSKLHRGRPYTGVAHPDLCSLLPPPPPVPPDCSPGGRKVEDFWFRNGVVHLKLYLVVPMGFPTTVSSRSKCSSFCC